MTVVSPRSSTLPVSSPTVSSRSTGPARPGPVARVLVRGVEAYQHLFAWRPSPCRFVPTCSNYALEALESHGAWHGGGLAMRRLCRCHPWGASGPDPVPERPVPERKAT